ncbi:MBL fold metallo-hydrolase [Flavihumibacter rivuli]|uniref:MBL fold metallo-hydrolase n=1 Tax=Flavihumibacter rivuli TaxID=2838156 RepID=UPI001BDE9977|nr:MBL fold metallo-hydrolase [Flavihumibacter rivuli]ULQ57596.1 MBL fold metallo-hydrolase [Flavihumibacter rivuli]
MPWKNLLLPLLTHLVVCFAYAQVDEFPTSKGTLYIHPVYHGSLWMEWDNRKIAIDPYGGIERYAAMGRPDLVFITDIHGDHMDSSTLVKMDLSGTIIIAPQAVKDRISTYLPSTTRIEVIGNGGKSSFKGVDVLALPMYNLPDTPGVRHPKGRGNGYVLNLGGKQVYISGDTEDIPEMRALKGIDIAFVCMNKPYTMDINQASSAVLAFQPKVVYPFHFRQPGGFSDVEAFRKMVNDGNKDIEVKLRQWY